MASIFSNPDYRAKLPMTDFDLSQPIDFSSIPGVLTPVYMDWLAPGERISGHAEMQTRTNELQTAAFAKIDEYIEYFFVPASKLNMLYNEWFFNIDDNGSAFRPAQLPERASTLPNISTKKFRELLKFPSGQFEQSVYDFESMTAQAIRLLSHFRYDYYHIFDHKFNTAWTSPQGTLSSQLWNISLMPFCVYQSVYYDYYRNSLWENNDVLAYNTDDWMTSLSEDTFTSDRLYRMIRLHLRNQNSDYFTSGKPSPLQNSTGMLNIDGVRENTLLRVNQWLTGTGFTFDFGKNGGYNVNVSANRDLLQSGLSPEFYGDGSPIGAIPSSLRTGSSNSFTNSSNAPSGAYDAEIYVNDDSAQLRISNTYPDPLSHTHSLNGATVNSLDGELGIGSNIVSIIDGLKSSINTQAIRVMFALEKLAKITAMSGKHYDDQVLAHYGYKVPNGYSNEVIMIGQQHSQIGINEVVSNVSIPDGSQAGEIFGKGYGFMPGNNQAFDFTAPCHGYFIAIYSAVPQRTYTPSGNPKEYSALRREDFPIPEFMNLGQQPLFTTEWAVFPQNIILNPVTSWNWRYMEYKCRVPMSIGAFSRVRYDQQYQSENGILSDWSIQYPVFNTDVFNVDPQRPFSTQINYYNLKVTPSSLNSLFLVGWKPDLCIVDGEVHPVRLFDRDPLFHHLEMKVYKHSYMTRFGEPRID